MIELLLVGIGTGNPDHLTLQAVKTLNSADLVMIPRKGETKADLADLSATETGSMVEALYAAIAGGNLAKARQLTQMLMITYGLSARELLVQLSDVFAREYHDPRVAVIVGDTDALLPNARG